MPLRNRVTPDGEIVATLEGGAVNSAWVLDWVAISVVADAGLVQPRLEQWIVFPHVRCGILKRHPDPAPGPAR